MDAFNLNQLAGHLLDTARASSSERAAKSLLPGAERRLRQTVIALIGGAELAEHESPGAATLQVLSGAVRLTSEDASVDLGEADLVAIPDARHALLAISDAVILLTVAVDLGAHEQEQEAFTADGLQGA